VSISHFQFSFSRASFFDNVSFIHISLFYFFSGLSGERFACGLFQYNLQTDMARRQLEFEAEKVHGEMRSTLGSADQSNLRQDARLRRIRAIEAEMVSLQRQQSGARVIHFFIF
jgi:hypothetical protein